MELMLQKKWTKESSRHQKVIEDQDQAIPCGLLHTGLNFTKNAICVQKVLRVFEGRKKLIEQGKVVINLIKELILKERATVRRTSHVDDAC